MCSAVRDWTTSWTRLGRRSGGPRLQALARGLDPAVAWGLVQAAGIPRSSPALPDARPGQGSARRDAGGALDAGGWQEDPHATGDDGPEGDGPAGAGALRSGACLARPGPRRRCRGPASRGEGPWLAIGPIVGQAVRQRSWAAGLVVKGVVA